MASLMLFLCRFENLPMYSCSYENKKKYYFLRKIQTFLQNNSITFRIKNAKFSGYYFYMKKYGDFQICISVPLDLKIFDNLILNR